MTPLNEPKAWADLSPFTQAYIEAALRWAWAEDKDDTFRRAWMLQDNRPLRWRDTPPAFSDLASKTVEGIIADCEARMWGWVRNANNSAARSDDTTEGRRFWRDRQAALSVAFPPVIVTLGDDGKVRFETPRCPHGLHSPSSCSTCQETV